MQYKYFIYISKRKHLSRLLKLIGNDCISRHQQGIERDFSGKSEKRGEVFVGARKNVVNLHIIQYKQQ